MTLAAAEEGDTKRFVVARKKLEEVVHWNSYEWVW